MILKIESSHNFRELGFNFQNKNVHDYLIEEAPHLRKICQGTCKSYVWKLPVDGAKTLTFAKRNQQVEFPPINSFRRISPSPNLFSQSNWELVRINGKTNFNPFEEKTLTISFKIRKNMKEIFLKNLYPTFPKVTGVDIFQFLMSLSYVCGFTLSLIDKSDISSSYLLLFGAGYYENVIKGTGHNTKYQNKTILKKDFYKCANFELQHLHLSHPIARIEQTLNSCQEKSISVQDCPVHFLWLGHAIHYTLFPKCGLNFKWIDFIPQPELEFTIIQQDLTRIFNKRLPELKPILYPIVNNCTPKEKNYKTFKTDVFSLKFFKYSFDFCFHDSKFTALDLFHILKNCVTETLNFLWKNECN